MLASTVLIERIGALPAGVTGRSSGPLPMRGKEQSILIYTLENRGPRWIGTMPNHVLSYDFV